MNAFLSSRKQLRAERAHARAVHRATARRSASAANREMLLWTSTNRFGA